MPSAVRVAGFLAALSVPAASHALGGPRVLEDRPRHLRSAGPREWAEFPAEPEADRLELTFDARADAVPRTLRLRQRDVKQVWRVLLNGKELGRLPQDENDMVVYLPIPAAAVADGPNVLRVEQTGVRPASDDVMIGPVALDPRPVDEALSEATVEVAVTEAGAGPVPCRLTILDADGALQSVGAISGGPLAVRPGVVYTAAGRARFGLPAGRYTIQAGRGFEYSLATADVAVGPGGTARLDLAIRREVPTAGWVACDTHVHTRTHSGHGDATVEERMVTIAGEGIELAVATDHDVAIDHDPFARAAGVRKRFTPVVGDEVTTKVGHFNVFPVDPAGRLPDNSHADWPSVFRDARAVPGVRVVILNHARDRHSGFRPFGPERYAAVVAEDRDGWPPAFDAMEVVNSGATQTDPLRLVRDWMGLLNAGRPVAPVGSSDSHDVARHFVGQGRTYLRCDDADPGAIDVSQAVDSLLTGRVGVSYGLIADLAVDGRHGPGDSAVPSGDEVRAEVRVLGPHWVTADRVELYMNGRKVREAAIGPADGDGRPAGVKWSGGWTLPRPGHDVHLVAVATGPGVSGAHWKTAKPYQPASPAWEPRVLGCCGAVWIDADGDGRRTSAREYAERLDGQGDGSLPTLVAALAGYDEAVAAHAARRYRGRGGSLASAELRDALAAAAPQVRDGFRAYLEAWREGETARSDSAP